MERSTGDRPALAARCDRLLEAAWRAGLASRPRLDSDELVAAAERRAGDRAAGGAWRERLALLCAELEEGAGLGPLGRAMAWGQLVGIIAARIRARAALRADPAIARRPLAAPLLIVGQMRSGTTRMHRLLAQDPAFAVTRLFEELEPPARRIDLRRPRAAMLAALLRRLNPPLAAIHPTGPAAPEESFGLQALSLWGSLFEGQWLVPAFARHLEAADPDEAYREFADWLRLVGHQRGDDPRRPWLLKAPQFAQDMAAVLRRFPDARLVVLRRAPDALVASGASLMLHHALIQAPAVSPAAIGAETLRKVRLRADRLAAGLAANPDIPRVELDFAEVGADWRGSVRQVYAMLGRPLDPAVESRMAAYLDRATGHYGHRYALADFGLSQEQFA